MNSGELSLSYLLFAEMLITFIRFRRRRLHGRRGLKFIVVDIVVWVVGSPPSRAAWIEIDMELRLLERAVKVAAFTGGVD